MCYNSMQTINYDVYMSQQNISNAMWLRRRFRLAATSETFVLQHYVPKDCVLSRDLQDSQKSIQCPKYARIDVYNLMNFKS